jgi:ParB family chromosome partitioning protein
MSALSAAAPDTDNPAGASASLERVKLNAIDTGARLRRPLPDRVEALAALIVEQGEIVPVDVVHVGKRLRLIDGAIRLAAARQLGRHDVLALVHPEGTFGSELDIRLREIAQNFARFELNALERAVHIAEWRTAHEQKFPPPKRGPKPKTAASADLDELSAIFAQNFTDTVQRVLGLSRRAIYLDLKIASIAAPVRERIAVHRIATVRTELLLLAGEPAGRQSAIAELLIAGQASTVDEAVAMLDQRPMPSPLAPYEKLSGVFSRLAAEQQHRFFDLHADAIDVWRAARRR